MESIFRGYVFLTFFRLKSNFAPKNCFANSALFRFLVQIFLPCYLKGETQSFLILRSIRFDAFFVYTWLKTMWVCFLNRLQWYEDHINHNKEQFQVPVKMNGSWMHCQIKAVEFTKMTRWTTQNTYWSWAASVFSPRCGLCTETGWCYSGPSAPQTA